MNRLTVGLRVGKAMKAIFAALSIVAGIGTATAATQCDYDYWTDSGVKPAWMPKSIKSDGQRTYIQFPDAELLAPPKPGEASLAPSLVVLKTAQGETSTYRYKVVGDHYEVIGVIEKAVLIGPSGDEHDRVLIMHGPAPTTDSK